MTETAAQTCPNAATCPSIHYCDPTVYSDHTRGPGYVIVGHVDSSDHAEAHGGHVGDGEIAVWVPANVIDALVREQTAELRAENDGLFLAYATEKSGRQLASEAFDEVRAERDKLAARVRDFEFAAEPRCGAVGEVCGEAVGPCELAPGHRAAYHRCKNAWWTDITDPKEPTP